MHIPLGNAVERDRGQSSAEYAVRFHRLYRHHGRCRIPACQGPSFTASLGKEGYVAAVAEAVTIVRPPFCTSFCQSCLLGASTLDTRLFDHWWFLARECPLVQCRRQLADPEFEQHPRIQFRLPLDIF